MLKLAADENFKEQIVNGLRLRELDITTAQEARASGRLGPIGEAIRDLILVAELLEPEETRDRVLRLPL